MQISPRKVGASFYGTFVYVTNVTPENPSGTPTPITSDMVVTTSVMTSDGTIHDAVVIVNPDQSVNVGQGTFEIDDTTMWPQGCTQWDMKITQLSKVIYTDTVSYETKGHITP